MGLVSIINLELKFLAYMAELLQHLLAMGQVWSHELGSIHLNLLPDFSRGQARLGWDRGKSSQLSH